MSSNLHFLVSCAKRGDRSATATLLSAFLPQIKKLSRSVNGEDTCQDLQLFLLELADKIPLERAIFQNDRILGAYIAHSLKRHSFSLQLKRIRQEYREQALDEANHIAVPPQFENTALVLTLLKFLTPKERSLLHWIYYYGYTCTEISKAHRISIQAVSQAKRKALNKLRKACTEKK